MERTVIPPRLPGRPDYTNPVNNSLNGTGIGMIRRARKRIKIGEIIANIFLGKEPGQSCNSPKFPIASELYDTHRENIIHNTMSRIDREISNDPTVGNGCPLADAYKREVTTRDKSQILRSYIETKMVERTRTGGKKRKSRKFKRSKSRKRITQRRKKRKQRR